MSPHPTPSLSWKHNKVSLGKVWSKRTCHLRKFCRGRVGWNGLADDEPIGQLPDRRELLLDRWRGHLVSAGGGECGRMDDGGGVGHRDSTLRIKFCVCERPPRRRYDLA